MTISELIEALTEIKETHGDLDCVAYVDDGYYEELDLEVIVLDKNAKPVVEIW